MLAKKNLLVALMGLGLVAGCGSSQGFTATSPGASNTGTVTIVEDGRPISASGDVADTLVVAVVVVMIYELTDLVFEIVG